MHEPVLGRTSLSASECHQCTRLVAEAAARLVAAGREFPSGAARDQTVSTHGGQDLAPRGSGPAQGLSSVEVLVAEGRRARADILDTGIRIEHEDFEDRAEKGWSVGRIRWYSTSSFVTTS